MSNVPEKYRTIFKDDALDISKDVIEFANLISKDKYQKDKGSKVYSISAKFGIGKTFFCDKLHKVLQKDNVVSSVFNVWKSDFYEDPIIPILSELNKIYMIANPGNDPLPVEVIKHRSWWKVIASGIKFNGKAKIPVIGEVGVEIDGEKMVNEHNRQDEIQSGNDEITIFDEYEAYESALEDLKLILKDWVSKKRKPVVIIIDELDRCRPDYAVKTLEVIKHFFDISGLVFVLAIDEEQLENSVRCLYGTTDFDGYKRKFISNSFRMAEPDNLKFAEMLYDKSGIEEFIKIHRDNKTEILIPNITERYKKIKNDKGGNYLTLEPLQEKEMYPNPNGTRVIFPTSKEVITRHFALFSHKRMFNFSLRQQEQVFDRILLFTKSLDKKYWFSPDLIVFLACLHEQSIDKELYNKFKEYTKNSIEPYRRFQDIFDFVIAKDPQRLDTRWKLVWDDLVSLRDGLLYKISEYRKNENTWNHQPVGNEMMIDKVNLFFDTANNDYRMKYCGFDDFDSRNFLNTYFSKMEFVSRFSDKPEEEKKSVNLDEILL